MLACGSLMRIKKARDEPALFDSQSSIHFKAKFLIEESGSVKDNARKQSLSVRKVAESFKFKNTERSFTSLKTLEMLFFQDFAREPLIALTVFPIV